jgi:hypothetical protein
VQNVEDDKPFFEYLINDDVRKSCDNEFPGALKPAVAASLGHGAQALNCIVYGPRNPVRRVQIPVVLDPFGNRL